MLVHIGAWQGVVLDVCGDVSVKIGKRTKGHKYELNIMIVYVYDGVHVSCVSSRSVLKRWMERVLSESFMKTSRGLLSELLQGCF